VLWLANTSANAVNLLSRSRGSSGRRLGQYSLLCVIRKGLRYGRPLRADPHVQESPPNIRAASAVTVRPSTGYRARMESSLGHDFGKVRVHSDTAAADAAHDLGAAAYTIGQHIVFGAGRYRPDTLAGDRLLTHELTHVAQNAAAGSEHLPWLSDPYHPAERQAETAAGMSGRNDAVCPVSGKPAALIQRAPETWLRGEAIGVEPAPAGSVLHDFGDGLYLTDSAGVAEQYAVTRAGDNPLSARRFSVTLEPGRLGRVLDLTQDVRWQAFLNTRAFPEGMTNEQLIRMANENYSHLFEDFARSNNIRLEEYDAIKGPEFVRGGTQICIRNPQIQAQVRAALTDLPISTAGSSATQAAAASAAEGGPEAAAAETAAAAAPQALTTAAETAAAAESGARAASLAGRLAVGLLETAVLVIVTLGLEYLKHELEKEHLRSDLKTMQPKIARAISALMPQARLLQQAAARPTVWAIVTIELRSSLPIHGAHMELPGLIRPSRARRCGSQ
jgi:uncharacterized protein DUF4157